MAEHICDFADHRSLGCRFVTAKECWMKTPEQKQIESLTKQRDELSEAAFVLIGDPMLGETSGSTSSTNMFVTFSALRRVRAAIAAAKPVKATSGYLEQPLRTEAEARAAAENQRGDDDG